MSTVVQHKRSTTATNIPTLSSGEIGLNLVDKRIFTANTTVVFDAFQNTVSNVSITNSTSGAFNVGNSTVNSVINSTAHSCGANVILDNVNLKIGNSTVNVFANSLQITVANSTTMSNVGPGIIFVGNSTVNNFSNSTVVKISNSTSNTTLPIPNTVQWAGLYYLHANGTWANCPMSTRVYRLSLYQVAQTRLLFPAITQSILSTYIIMEFILLTLSILRTVHIFSLVLTALMEQLLKYRDG